MSAQHDIFEFDELVESSPERESNTVVFILAKCLATAY